MLRSLTIRCYSALPIRSVFVLYWFIHKRQVQTFLSVRFRRSLAFDAVALYFSSIRWRRTQTVRFKHPQTAWHIRLNLVLYRSNNNNYIFIIFFKIVVYFSIYIYYILYFNIFKINTSTYQICVIFIVFVHHKWWWKYTILKKLLINIQLAKGMCILNSHLCDEIEFKKSMRIAT